MKINQLLVQLGFMNDKWETISRNNTIINTISHNYWFITHDIEYIIKTFPVMGGMFKITDT